jgi:hypothetical protein
LGWNNNPSVQRVQGVQRFKGGLNQMNSEPLNP